MILFEQLAAVQHLPEQHDTPSQALDLCVDLHCALHMLRESRQSFAYLRKAETLAERLGDQRRLCESYRAMTHKCWVLGAYDDAIAYSQRALALAAASGDVSSSRL